MKIHCNNLRLLLIIFMCHDIYADSMQRNVSHVTVSHGLREDRAGIVGFKRFGNNVAVGLDFVLPFIKVATQTKRNELGKEEPLISINTAAIILTGLLAGGGLIVAQIFRTIGLQGTYYSKSDKGKSLEKRLDVEEEESEIMQMLENFKLVYKNATGHKVETNLPVLFETIRETFDENDINLPVCLEKALCLSIHKATTNVKSKSATNIEKIIDGLAKSEWFLNSLASSVVRDAIGTGRHSNGRACSSKYLECQWDEPDIILMELFTENIKLI